MSILKSITVKKILTLALLIQGLVFAVFASGDPNDYPGHLSDLEFSNSKDAVYVNEIFIKSAIGIDLSTKSIVTRVIREKCKDPLIINGFSYTDKVILLCDENTIIKTF